MALTTPGLHHVTAIAGDPGENADFYVNTLGLRFVKRTVNHDDPGTYHFYFGDRKGTPGTNITFFPWTERGRPGRFGAGQTQDTAYLIRPESVEYWVDRLDSKGIGVEPIERFGETVLRFTDPDGIGLELVASGEARSASERASGGTASEDAREADVTTWDDGPVPAEHQLRGFHGVTLAVAEFGPTESVLTDVLGYELEDEGERGGDVADGVGRRRRYRSAAGGPASVVDLVETDAGRGRMGVGSVHHVAFVASDEAEQERWREALRDHGRDVTEIVDRRYFRSIYSREPGGVLFELATTGPGFDADEDVDELGSSLKLPPWLEDRREEIESRLPKFEWPTDA